ncbi:MAG: alcohol dehydrogenase catalytic domain-containing protein, partial [Planctomycetes bacterium]|nr:alcohol dehydrogenase catalytic domain-containing protein [Planctomycetota bacterium]
MKALSIAAPGNAEYRELAQPTPAADEVLMRVRYVGYCGSDLTTYRGLNPLVSYPRIPGHEVSGVVSAVGAGVGPGIRPGMAALVIPYTSCGACPSCRAGRANCCVSNQTLGVQRDGALAEWLVAPAAKVIVAPALGLRALAMVEPLTIG